MNNRCNLLKLTRAIALSGFLEITFSPKAFAQETLVPIADDTLGLENSEVEAVDDITSRINGGAIRDTNLFHSFLEFNVGEGRAVYFANPVDIENIFSRVTGGNPSSIFGTLGVEGPANLFLLNPNGVLFGPEASLDLQGSFLTTTADSLLFPNGEAFSATNPQPPSLLTVSVPLGLQYGTEPPGAIAAQGSDLSVEPGRSLVLAGGAIALDSSVFTASGGRLELGAAADTEVVGLAVDGNELNLEFGDGSDQADVGLSNTTLRATAEGGGDIAITAHNLDLSQGSLLEAGIAAGLGTGEGKAGDIVLDATGVINMSQASSLENAVFSDAIGNSGDIRISAERFTAMEGAQLENSISGRGEAGDVTIQVDDAVVFDGFNSVTGSSTGAFSEIDLGGTGTGGSVIISATNLVVSNGAQLGAGTLGQGAAGSVVIDVKESAIFSGFNSSNGFPSGAFGSVEPGAEGSGGDVRITASELQVSDGAQISSVAFGQGAAGSVIIGVTGTATFDGFNGSDAFRGFPSGAFSRIGPAGEGAGRNVEIRATDLRVLNGAQLSASNFGRGQAGSVIVEVLENAVFDGFDSSDGSPSGAFSSILPDGQGVGGDVRIAASNLEVTNGAQLSAAAFGLGDAGNVIIEVKDNVIFANINTFNGRSSGAFSSILPNGEGAGGDIHISATNLVISDGANVSANALGLGNAGNIVFQLSERLLVDDGTIATNARFASGGEVIIETDSVLLRRNSDIQTFVNVGEGKGGDVVIRADSILAFEDSDILAFAQDGQGGNITLDALGFFGENYQPSPEGIDPLTLDGNDRVDINASGAISGIITLPDISFIENSLTELPDTVVNTEQLIAGSCIARTARSGSFIVSGSGGLPDRPGDAFLPPYPTGEIRSLSGEAAADSGTPADEIVEPQGVFQLADGQIVISRLCESE